MTDDLKDFHHSREFFDLRVPSVFTWFPVIVAGIFAGGLLWAALGDIDIIVKAPAVLRPEHNVSTLKNAVAGPMAVQAFTHGQKVHKGALLWKVDTSALEVDRANVALQLTRNGSRVQTVTMFEQALIDDKDNVPVAAVEAKTRAAVYFSDTARLTLTWTKALQAWDREKALPAGMVTEQKVSDLSTEAALAKIALDGYRAQERLKVREELTTLATEREALARRTAELEAQKADSEVRAPLDGTVEELKKVNRGDYLLVGEELARLVPDGAERLKLELSVDNRDIAEVKPGLLVRVRFASLAPSEYGQLEARVTTVPADATTTAAVFVVGAAVEQTWLENKRGERVVLKPGMTAEARILLKRKNILRYLLEQLDFLS